MWWWSIVCIIILVIIIWSDHLDFLKILSLLKLAQHQIYRPCGDHRRWWWFSIESAQAPTIITNDGMTNEVAVYVFGYIFFPFLTGGPSKYIQISRKCNNFSDHTYRRSNGRRYFTLYRFRTHIHLYNFNKFDNQSKSILWLLSHFQPIPENHTHTSFLLWAKKRKKHFSNTKDVSYTHMRSFQPTTWDGNHWKLSWCRQ